MFPRRRDPRLVLASALVLAGALQVRAELVASSPFLPPQGEVAARAAKPSLEFRGVATEGANTRLSIFDSTKHSGRWVGLGDSDHEFTVKNYDPESNAVTVDFQGRTLTLAMRTPKIASFGNAVARLPAPSPISSPVAANPVTRTVVTNPTPANEAALASWTAEIERRRTMRGQPTAPAAVAPRAVPTSVPPTGRSPAVKR